MTDYSNSCVYRFIFNNITYYVGSTVNYERRYGEHKSACNNSNGIAYNYPLYTFMRNNGGFLEMEMELLQSYPDCKSDLELRMHEQHHYDIYNPPLNAISPHRTKEELVLYQSQYQKIYRASHSDYMPNYRVANKAVLDQKRAVVVNCPCGSSHKHCGTWGHLKSKKHQKYLVQVAKI